MSNVTMAADVTPIAPKAEQLANALFELLEAKQQLDEAKRMAPAYTGQYSEADMYAQELNEYNLAANKYEAVIRSISQDERE
ncbi:MAG: hypothetical protein RSD49_07985 [Hafnia sp.]